MALVAVGGYGRGDLAPHSDLDLILVRADPLGEVDELAARVWAPLWDHRLDHSVRTVTECVEQARADLRVAMGLLDARHVAGDPHVTLRLRTLLLADWRRAARARLPELQELVSTRHRIAGELAHEAVPDLKEAAGGLRDATVLAALRATWLVDVPHVELASTRRELLDARDVLHAVAGRATDRVAPELWRPLAQEWEGLGDSDALAAQRRVRELGARIAHLSRLAWRRVDGLPSRSRMHPRGKPPRLLQIAPGLAEHQGEIVLVDPAARDPQLLLRAAAEAAELQLVLGPASAARLASQAATLPDPWPESARRLLVRLLGAGAGLLPVWETLEQTGALDRILPEWEAIRLLPHASTVHRFTVDRHVVETCIEAAAMTPEVGRPDLLVVGALLHDIGKGGSDDHSVVGDPIARRVATRWGFGPADVAVIGTLVRRHLLLVETATTRDLADPAVVDQVAGRVGSVSTLELLAALTEADAKATAAKAWSTWRAGLVAELVDKVAVRLAAPVSDLPVPPGRTRVSWRLRRSTRAEPDAS